MAVLPTEEGSKALFAILIALAVGFIKLVEASVSWMWKKHSEKKEIENDEHKSSPNGHSISLYANQFEVDAVKAIRDIHEENSEMIREMVNCLKDISYSQERIVKKFDDIDDKIDKVRNDTDDIIRTIKRS